MVLDPWILKSKPAILRPVSGGTASNELYGPNTDSRALLRLDIIFDIAIILWALLNSSCKVAEAQMEVGTTRVGTGCSICRHLGAENSLFIPRA